MTQEEEVARLQVENQDLKRQLAQALEQLAVAQQRIAELEQQRDDPPAFVKPNRPKANAPKQPRRKRKPEHNHGRRRDPPTRIEQHALERCPTCHYRLRGHSRDYVRQVIELPLPQPVEVIEHQVVKRWCPHCARWRTPKLALQGQVLGQGRMGVRIVSLIAYLRTTLRLPLQRIQTYLHTLHGLTISRGELVELLHQARRALNAPLDQLKAQARASPIVHGDETGWRENGQNGYVWAFSTPGRDGVRYYEYDHSRGRGVVKRILGGTFRGILSSDFYSAYNIYAGKHQRCWAHLLRALHDLKAACADQAAVLAWASAVRQLYEDAHAFAQTVERPNQEQCEQQYVTLVEQACELARQYAQSSQHPCRALAKRLLRHQDELFQFVLIEGLSATNNLAERSIRPLVVIRKISGGTRSLEGSQTRMALVSLFETWHARGLNPFDECFKLLSQSSLPQV